MHGKKIDATVKKETAYIGVCTFILSLLLQAVFLILAKWDYTVLLGNVLGFFAAVGNFFLMGLTVQMAVEKNEEDAKKLMKVSQSGRLLGLLVIALIGFLLPGFELPAKLAIVIPYLFPRIAVAIRPAIKKF